MIQPPVPGDEAARLEALRALGILDTPPEERFDRITRLARRIFDAPIALVSLVDRERLWFKSHPGLAVREMPRHISFCSHAILGSEPLIVPDAGADARFAAGPLVAAPDGVRFYAGQPLRTRAGFRVGALCIADTRPRTLDAPELRALTDLAGIAEGELEAVSRDDHQAGIDERRRAQEDLQHLFSITRSLFCILEQQERFRNAAPAAADAGRERPAARVPAAAPERSGTMRTADGGAQEVLGRLSQLAGTQQGGTVPDLLELFLANTDAGLGTLRHAAESSDLRTLKRAAQKLRGSSATFGASRLADACLKLETVGESVLLGGGLEMVRELEQEFALLKNAVRLERHAGSGRSGGSAS